MHLQSTTWCGKPLAGITSQHKPRVFAILAALAVAGGLSLMCLPAAAVAATGGVVSLPLPKPAKPGPPPKPNPRAMSVSIDTTWVECSGYRPVRVTITPTPPLTVDRTITLNLRPGLAYSGLTAVGITQDVELPANVASITATLYVPQMEPWQSFSFDLYDDGEPVEELSLPLHRFIVGTANNQWGDGASPNVLFLGPPRDPAPLFQDFGRMNESAVLMGLPPTTLFGAVPTPTAVFGATPIAGTATTVTAGFAGVPGIQTVGELPESWLGYSGLDVIFVSLPELQELIQKNPAQWQAMRTWVTAGGNLWVTSVGRRWERLDTLAELVELPAVVEANSQQGNGPLDGWTKPVKGADDSEVRGITRRYPGGMVTMEASASGVTMSGSPDGRAGNGRPGGGTQPPPFVMRDLGRGQVVAIAQEDPLATNRGRTNWRWVFNSVGPQRWQWFRRHGISLQRSNDDFWDFLIPGVGLAPVTEFQVLITLFVLLIGPVNFFLLRRWHKLNLIMITVPVSAAAITICLLLYALAADGLGVRLRARSFTEIDQRREEAVCWSRLSYYAGLAPSQGLSFPTDTTVYPIDHDADGGSYRPSRQVRDLDWGQKQYLGDGWLHSRTPTQFLTVSARSSQRKLDIAESSDGSPPRVTNLLDARIQQLVLVDAKGRYFTTQGLSAGREATLTAVKEGQTPRELFALYSANPLDRPPGVGNSSYGLFGVRRRTYYYNGNSTDLDNASLRTSVLERALKECCGIGQSLPWRSYVAVTDTAPEMSLGTEAAREESSFHVILGHW